MSFVAIFEQILILFLILMAGFAARNWRIIDDTVTKGLSSLLLKLAVPALIIDSLQRSFSRELLWESGQILVISLCVYAGSILFALLVGRLPGTKEEDLGVVRFATVFSNVGFMGYPVVLAVLGQESLFHAAVFNLPFNFLSFTVGILLITGGSSQKHNLNWRVFLNPALVAVAVGFLLFLFSINLPHALGETIRQVGSLTTPLSMIVVGSTLYGMQWRDVFGNWVIYLVSAVRLILAPLVVWGILGRFVHNPLLVSVPVLLIAMPVAVNSVLFAEEYDANSKLASQVVFLSTLLSILTIPLIVLLTAL
jgi:predicted permease